MAGLALMAVKPLHRAMQAVAAAALAVAAVGSI
jgi:hypothetical protein